MVLSARKNIFVTFGAGRSGWIGAAKRITSEAEKTELFEFCFNLNEYWLKSWDPTMHKIGLDLRKIQPPRGFGYWTWKPSVLLWADLHFPNHNLFYFDAGTQIDTSLVKVNELSDALNKVNAHGQIAWHLPQHLEVNWTKKEVLNYFASSLMEQNSGQVQSGFIGFSPGRTRSKFVRSFRNSALERQGFYFTDELIQIQNSSFIEHRHDQSIMSCLWKSEGFYSEEDPSHPMSHNSFPIIAYRNNSILPIETLGICRRVLKFLYLTIDFIFRRRR